MNNISNLDWRTIPEFPDYAVTPDGQVWSFKSKRFLKLMPNKQKYLTVELRNDLKRKCCRVHRLVGMAFVKLPPEFKGNYDMATINHKDHNRQNNHYSNLEWVTQSHNSQEAWDNGYCDNQKKECFCVSIEDKKYTKRDSASDMDKSLNLPEGTVSKAIGRANGIIQGKYIVGYTEDLDKKYLLPKPDEAGIIQLYSNAIANYKSYRKECFCISIEDEKYTPFDSVIDMVQHLNLPKSTVAMAINKGKGILQGKYIVGYTEDLDKKYLSPKPDATGIIQLYSKAIANYTPSKNPCSYIDSLDNSYHESESISDIDKKLNLPAGTAKQAIRRNHGLIRGRYIAGCLNDRRWRGLITKCTVEQIVESYAKKIERYKQRGPRKITNLETGESEVYDSLVDFAREKGISLNNAGQYLKNHPDLYKVELA